MKKENCYKNIKKKTLPNLYDLAMLKQINIVFNYFSFI